MAQTLSISGSLLIGNPIEVSIKADTVSGVNFHRVKLEVEISLLYAGTEHRTFVLSSPASSGETVSIDISSALRAMVDGYSYQREETTYPYLTYNLRAYDEYMRNGQQIRGKVFTQTGLSAITGAFTPEERMEMTRQHNPVQFFSRKPKTGEVIAQDENLMYPVPFPVPISENLGFSQKTKKFVFDNILGVRNITFGDLYDPSVDYGKTPYESCTIPQTETVHSVYVVPASPDRYPFYFLNTMGVIETISAVCFPEVHQKTQSKIHLLSTSERFSKPTRSLVRKHRGGRTYKMSSGPVNREWLDWWVNEFLMTEMAWVRVDGKYLPCNIIANEDTLVRKESDDHLFEVSFTVEINL